MIGIILRHVKWIPVTLLLTGIISVSTIAQPRPDSPDQDSNRAEQESAIVSGDSLSGFQEAGKQIQIYIGNVNAVQDSTELLANWARRVVEDENLLLVGDVWVMSRGDTLQADTVDYSEAERLGDALGNVRLSDGEAIVYAPSGRYFADEKRVLFENSLRLEDSTATVVADSGTYWTDDDLAEVAGSVQLDNEEAHLEADSLTYWRELEISFARGGVGVERSADDGVSRDSTWLFGDRLHMHEGTGKSQVWGQPLLIQLRQDSSSIDSLAILAEVLTLIETDSLRTMTATSNTRYWSPDFSAIADSMVFLEELNASAQDKGRIVLFGSPIVWTEGSQITGDSMQVFLSNQTVDSLHVWGEVFVAQEDTVLGRINQVRGLSLKGWFEEDGLRMFRVRPNAEVLYFQRTDNDGPDGAIQVSGDEAILVLQDDQPQSLSFGEHQGTYFPEETLQLPMELDGYRWEPVLQPLIGQFFSDPRYVTWKTGRPRV